MPNIPEKICVEKYLYNYSKQIESNQLFTACYKSLSQLINSYIRLTNYNIDEIGQFA